MTGPLVFAGPTCLNFSGGRTSARLLWELLQAYGGRLPDDVVVAFANTGRERPETLRFVWECASRWDVQVHLVEWRDTAEGFEEVGFNSAAMAGEPFAALIRKKQRLPRGAGEKWCTEFLKVRPVAALMRHLGHGEPGDYAELIGLRHDEQGRILKGKLRAAKAGRRVHYPLDDMRLSKRDVRRFWWGLPDARFETRDKPQGFDLELDDLWGNCDLCYVMGAGIRRERLRRRPETGPWWNLMEVEQGATFAMRESVAELQAQAAAMDEAEAAQLQLFADTFNLFDADADGCTDVCGEDDEG